MASGLESPFDGLNPDFTAFGCVIGASALKASPGPATPSELLGSGWQNSKSIALLAVESICFTVLLCCVYFTRGSKYTWKGKPDRLRINSIRIAICSTMLSVAMAISFIALRSSFVCALKDSYPYLYTFFGLGWRIAEIVTAAIIARTLVEQLYNTKIPYTHIVSRTFTTWISFMTVLTVVSYMLYVLWIARLAIGHKTAYSKPGFSEDYAYVNIAYQIAYVVLAGGFLLTLLFSLWQHTTSKHRRNLLLLIVVPLVFREIEQAIINAVITYSSGNDLTALNLIDALIYDTTTTCMLFALALLGERDPDQPDAATTVSSSGSFDKQSQASLDQKPYIGRVSSDSHEKQEGIQVAEYSSGGETSSKQPNSYSALARASPYV